MHISRSGKDFVDRSLNVLLLDKALLTAANSFCTAGFTGLLWSGKWLRLVASSLIQSRVIIITELIELYIGYHFKLPSHPYFYWRLSHTFGNARTDNLVKEAE